MHDPTGHDGIRLARTSIRRWLAECGFPRPKRYGQVRIWRQSDLVTCNRHRAPIDRRHAIAAVFGDD